MVKNVRSRSRHAPPSALALSLSCIGIGCALLVDPQSASAQPGVPDLLPHTVLYDLRLVSSNSSAPVQDVRGSFRYDFEGNHCNGYTITVVLSNQLVDKSGNVSSIEQFSSSFEDPTKGIYSFVDRQEVNGVTVEATRGEANISGQSAQVSLEKEDHTAPKTEDLGQGIMFPMQFLTESIIAAQQNKVFLNTRYYDGSDGGSVTYDVSGVIGRERTVDLNGSQLLSELGPALKAWPMSLAYFQQGGDAERASDPQALGEQLPDYQMSYMLFENGVSDELLLDYGDFVIRGEMVEFETLPVTACE